MARRGDPEGGPGATPRGLARTTPGARLLAGLWLLVLAGLTLFGALRLATGRVIQTDLLAMLPATERNPVAEAAIERLARIAGDRAVFLVGADRAADDAAVPAGALAFAAGLQASGAFTSVTGRIPPVDPGMVPRFYAPYRFRLPGPGLPDAPGALAARIEAGLASPMGSLGGLGGTLDPLGEFGGFLAGLPLGGPGVAVEDGLLTLRSGPAHYVLVVAALRGSAFDPGIQRAALAAADAAGRDLAAARPGLRVLRTGSLFYAADARTRAEREAGLIGWISVAAVLALFLGVFRSLRHLLLGLACVGAGLATAIGATLLAFGQIHLMTLVVGASLVGVAVDYPFLLFAHHLGAGSGWDARAALARLLPALALGFATSVLGFAAMGVAPFPGLRQMAVFSTAGLAGSFLTVTLLLPAGLAAPMATSPRLFAALDRPLARWRAALAALKRPGLVLAALLVLAAGLRLRVDDDVHNLIQPSPELQAQEARIRDLTGLDNSARFFLVEGGGEGEVLAREEALRERLAPLLEARELDRVQAVSAFVPSPARQDAALAARIRRAPALAAAMAQVGFRPDAVAALARDLRAGAGRPLAVADWLATPFAVPFRHLWLGSTARGCGSVVLLAGPCPSARLEAAARDLPGVVLVDKARSVSRLMGHYRRLADGALVLAVALVWLLLARWYGWRRGTVVLAPTLGGMVLAVAAAALAGQPLTLFHTMALVLVLGFAVDYAVFLAEAGGRPGPALLGVLLAGVSTLLSYGLLAFSGTPALRGFGFTLGAAVLGALALAPLAWRGVHPKMNV
jgi:predicted exporter